MMDYSVLKTKIDADHSGDSEKTIAIALNAQNLTGWKEVATGDIMKYLFVNSLWVAIKTNTSVAARQTIDALEIFPTFDLPVTEIRDSFEGILDDLVADATITEFTATHKTGILALGSITQSWAQQTFDCPVSIRDIRIAKGL